MLGNRYAYRVLWEHVRGPLDRATVLHHRCENPWCVNLDHLEPMTQSEHMRLEAAEHGRLLGDANVGQSDKTHCPRDHEYTEENTYVVHRIRDGKPVIERHCRKCLRINKRAWRAENPKPPVDRSEAALRTWETRRARYGSIGRKS